jgi:hypothetical protein
VAGNLGLTELQRQARQLEALAPLENFAAVREAVKGLATTLTQLSASILEILGQQDNPRRHETMDSRALSQRLDRLQSLLKNQEGESQDCLDQITPALRWVAPSDLLDALQQDVQQFDFDSAFMRLKQIRQAPGVP